MADITEKIKTTLSDAFNQAVHHEFVMNQEVAYVPGKLADIMLPYIGFDQPPVDFEKRTGIQGVSCQYFLPPDLLPRELQEYGMISLADDRTAQARLSEVWGHLKECNPDTLGRLKFDTNNTMNLYHVILGAASAFPPQDIQAWLDGWHGQELCKDPEASLLLNKIETCLGAVYWIPSLETLRMIERQMNSHGAKPAPDARTQPAAGNMDVFEDIPVSAMKKTGQSKKPPSI